MLEIMIKSDSGTNMPREYAILVTWSSTILAKYNLATTKFWQIHSFSIEQSYLQKYYTC